MNRRRFLTMLGIAPVVVQAAPLLKALPENRRRYAKTSLDGRDDLIGGWVSYKYYFTVLPPPDRSAFSRLRLVA